MSKRANKVICAGWVIPVEPAGTVLENHAVVVSGEKISAVLPAAEARSMKAAEVVDLPGHALVPGLVNMHGHAAMSLFRGYADDLPLIPWLEQHIWPLEARHASPDFVRDGGDLAIAEMIRSGTTCFSDMYFFPDVMAERCHRAGIRCQLTFPVIGFPSAWAGSPEEYIHKGLDLHDSLKHSALVKSAFGPHSTYTLDEATLGHIASLANELDVPVQIHLHETAEEVADAERATGRRPLASLHALGLTGPRMQLVHMTQLHDEEIELLGATGSHVVHCPNSNMKLASGRCPVRRLQDAGVNVALGTDSAASNNSLSLLGEMRSAALLAKVGDGDATSLPAHRVLEMATLGGARAMGRERELGSIGEGKLADLVAVDMSWPETQPLHNPISHLVYAAQSAQVTHSWVAGQALMADRQLLTVDVDEVTRRAGAWRETLRTAP